jgi:hypothetical protein
MDTNGPWPTPDSIKRAKELIDEMKPNPLYDALCRAVAYAGMMQQHELADAVSRLDKEAERAKESRDQKAIKVASIIVQMYQEGSPYNPLR